MKSEITYNFKKTSLFRRVSFKISSVRYVACNFRVDFVTIAWSCGYVAFIFFNLFFSSKRS